MLALENENFQNVRTHSRKATCSKNSRILPSWNDVDDPTSAPKEMSPFLRVLHYSYESWVNDVYFGDLHRSFYNLHSSTPKKEEKSLLFTPLSHLCTQQHSQQPLSLTTYHRIISSICDSQHIIENHHVQNSTTTEDKDELLWFFSLFLGNKPRTDRKVLNKRALLIFANHFCCINIL